MSPDEIEQRKKFRDGATAALARAAKRARELARQTGTELVVMRDGQLVREVPKDDAGDQQRAQGSDGN
jgi:hypothetical protein